MHWLSERQTVLERCEAYRRIALAIIVSGVRDKDIPFLAGDWCRWLCEQVSLDYDGREIMRRMGGLWKVAWKDTERALAKRLNAKRVGNTGKATMDVVSDWLCVEVKERKRLPSWLWQALRQAVAANMIDTRLPLAILHEAGQRHDNDLVVMRLVDFEEWFGEVSAIGRS